MRSVEGELVPEIAERIRQAEAQVREEAGRAQPRDSHRGDAAPGVRAERRGVGHGRPPSVGRAQGPDHRARGTQHPRARGGDRRRRHRRRHPRGDRAQLVRPGAPRGRPGNPRTPLQRRAHPSGAHRGDGRQGPQRAGPADQARGRAGLPGHRAHQRPSRAGPPARHAALSQLLRPQRALAQPGHRRARRA